MASLLSLADSTAQRFFCMCSCEKSQLGMFEAQDLFVGASVAQYPSARALAASAHQATAGALRGGRRASGYPKDPSAESLAAVQARMILARL